MGLLGKALGKGKNKANALSRKKGGKATSGRLKSKPKR